MSGLQRHLPVLMQLLSQNLSKTKIFLQHNISTYPHIIRIQEKFKSYHLVMVLFKEVTQDHNP